MAPERLGKCGMIKVYGGKRLTTMDTLLCRGIGKSAPHPRSSGFVNRRQSPICL
jgi:hypothetical protein